MECIVNPHRVQFRLHEPWPDFMASYGSPATGAGWIVPKNYTGKVSNEAFKNQPVGLGPYRFISYQPGVELVLEAFPHCWRKTPECQTVSRQGSVASSRCTPAP